MGHQPQPDAPPITWPRVKIGDQDLQVKYDFMVTYQMSRLGIDVRKLGLAQTTMAAHLDVFAVAVQHNFPEGEAPTADQWALELSKEEDPESIAIEIAKAVQESFHLNRSTKKAKPVTATPAPPAAATGS